MVGCMWYIFKKLQDSGRGRGQTGVNRSEPCFQTKGEKLAPG